MDALAHLDVWEKLFALTSPRPGWMKGQDGLPPPLPRGQRPQIMAAIGGIDDDSARSDCETAGGARAADRSEGRDGGRELDLPVAPEVGGPVDGRVGAGCEAGAGAGTADPVQRRGRR